jgi:NADH-quinone oxidoreductase subunit E
VDLLRRHHQGEIDAAMAKYPPGRQAAAAIEVLFLAQAAYGHLSEDAVAEVALVLEMEPTHVEALVGFYTLLMDQPHGRYVVHYCNDMPCALRGADELLPTLAAKLGCAPGETSADGMFSLQTVMCLAACDHAPMMQVNLDYFEDLSEDKLDELVADLRARAEAAP